MTSEHRPRQVTLGAWAVIVGSAVVVLAAFERAGSLRTWETRQQIEAVLRDTPVSGAVDAGAMLDLLRVLAIVAACCAAAAAVLGWQLLRSRRASTRTLLTVLAVPLALTGLVTAGLLPLLVVAGVVMLWLPAAREWFVRTPPGPPPAAASQTAPPRPVGRSGFGDRPGGPGPGPGVPGRPQAFAGTAAPPLSSPVVAPAPSRRPPAMVWACVLTWVGSGLVSAGMLLSAAVLAAAPGMVLDRLREQRPDLADQLDRASVAAAVYGVTALVVVWSTAAVVLAVLTYRRVRWARVALMVSAGLTAAFCLPVVLGSVLPLLPLLAAVATFVLLARPEVRAWCR